MARPKNSDRKAAVVEAAIAAIAELGTGAPTTLIAKRAAVAHGSIFTYFGTKAALFNAVFLQLKDELYAAVLVGLPSEADARQQLHHLWTAWIHWGTSNPTRRRALAQLAVSDMITTETLATTRERAHIGVDIFQRVGAQGALRDQPIEFVGVFFRSLAGTTVDFIIANPAQAEEYISAGFEALWRALR